MGMDRLTLLDIAREQDPDGKIAQIAEILTETNPILQDAPMLPSNADMGNRVTLRSTLPTVQRAKINQGTTRSKGTTKQMVDTIGMYDGRSEVDSRLAYIVGAGNFAQARANEDDSFVEALNQLMADDLFYGDEAIYESGCTGLQPRLETAATAKTGSQVAKHHGSPSGSDYTSIFIVDWHPRYVHLIYPKAHRGGIVTEDHGKVEVLDAESKPFDAFVTYFLLMFGLTIRDPRHIGRLANIDVSQALADTSTLIFNSLVPMLNRMPKPNGARRVLYCSTNVKTAIELQVKSVSNLALSIQDYLGEPTPHVHGYPVRDCDAISEAESLVS